MHKHIISNTRSYIFNNIMLLLSCGYLPQYKIPEVEKHKIMTRNCVVILKIKKIEKNNQ